MHILKRLWTEEHGAVLTAEAAMVGTVTVLGSVVGLNMASTAVNDELKDVAFAIRSLDQSYGYIGQTSCRGWSAGSYFHQQRVETSLQELCANGEADIALIKEHVDAQRGAAVPTVIPQHVNPDAPAANELPEKKVEPRPEPKKKKSKDKDKDD